MNKELINNYLSEVQSPSLRWDDEAKCINPAELRRYTGLMETLRVGCIQAIEECEPTMQRFYLDELKAKRKVILMRGYASLETSNLLDYIMSADNAGGTALMSYQQLDKMLLQSVDKTISVVEAMVGGNAANEGSKEMEATETTTETLPDVISGTNGLAEYLGCSHNTAFNIIKSRVLPRNVQYMTGKVWKFNRKRLDEYLLNHPEALGNIRK